MKIEMVTRAFRWCVYGVIAVAAVRAAAYLLYVRRLLFFPLETHVLEATMVHHAWRVLSGSPLYPAWEDYPHVSNFFTPVYFWIVGGLGRAAGAGIPDLFAIGRLVSVLSTLLAGGCLAWYLRLRHGRRAALLGALLSVGAAPLYSFSIMTRPDVTADSVGLAGLLMTMAGGRRSRLVGSALLVIAILTKQTAAMYLLAGIVLCLGERRYTRALLLAGSSAAGLALATIILTRLSAPLFLRSVLQERYSPLSANDWMATTARLAIWSPELLILSVAGIVMWLRQKEYGVALAVTTLFVGSLLTAFKLGSDLNYFLPLRATSVIAAGSLYAAARDVLPQRRSWAVAAAAGAVLVLIPSTLTAVAAAGEARALSSFIKGPSGARMLETYALLIQLVQTQDVRVLTDSGTLALYQKERAPFVDPWLFQLLVRTHRIEPRQMEQWLESRSYDYLILTADLYSSTYDDNAFGLPLPLVRKARGRYTQVAYAAGLFIYQRRPAS
jgi:hypothetical protein